MNKIKKINLKQYLITILISIIFALIIAFVIELELLFRCEKLVNFSELNVENLSKFCTIEELEKQLAKTPDDIIVNIRLGKMYEELKKLDKANDFYKNALRLSSRSDFAIYSYAMFCARQDMFVFAATLAEELSTNSKKANLFKAQIYEQIALGLDKSKSYEASVKSYQIAYKYAKSVGDLKYFNRIKELYSNEYIKLADYNMSFDDVAESESNLKNSLKIKKNALANYKLGLIYLNNQPRLAEKHINEAFFADPYIVNPYVYNSLLQDIINETKVLNEENLTNYYYSRLTRFKHKVLESYLYKDELIIDNSKIVDKKPLFGEPKQILSFEIKNNTKETMNNLFVKAEFFVNGEKYVFDKKVLNPTHPLEAYETYECLDLVLPKNVKFNDLKQNNDIFVRYFAKKKEEAPWILIKIDFLNI